MSVQDRSEPASAAGIVTLVASLIAIYIVSQFLRASLGVIAPDLATELSLSAAEIGLLSSAFFFSFAAVQLPLGVAIDHFGAKRCVLAFSAVTVVGAVVFALATSQTGLIVGRLLLGVGCAASFVGPLTIYARRFPPERFATLTGIQLGSGSTGVLLATAPLAIGAATIGWRGSFFVVALVALSATLMVALAVDNDGGGARTSGRRETMRESLTGVLQAMRTPGVARLFLMQLTGYSSFLLLIGLWGGPYLAHVYGMGLKERGDFLLIAAVAQIVGSFCWGTMDRLFRSYKIPILAGAMLSITTLLSPVVFGVVPTGGLIVWLIAFGIATANTPLMIAHGKSLFPPHLVGRGITLMNSGTIGGVFLTQAVSGWVIDLYPAVNGVYPFEAYRAVFALQAGFLAVACLGYVTLSDPLRNRREAAKA